MPEVKRRKPQLRCKCGHARKNHVHGYITVDDKMSTVDKWTTCGFCWDKCAEFKLDPLTTWERLYEFNQTKVSL